MTGREPTTAHPLCTCVADDVSLLSLVGIATPQWTGLKYVRRVTPQRRATCVVHRPNELPEDRR